MSNAICRAFTLYHDKIFVNSAQKDLHDILKKDYVVIGYFDWFKTIKWEMDESFSLTQLFDYNNSINREGTAFQSFQNVFGFRSDSAMSPCSDEEFWSENNDDRLTFILYLQMKSYKKDQFKAIEEILTEKFTGESYNDKQFIVYYTLDKNDYVVCFRSLRYDEIVEAINLLYDELKKKDNEIIYSYTNLIVRYDLIKETSSNLNSEKREEIASICIKTILNNNNVEYHSIMEKIDSFCRLLAKAFYDEEGEKKREEREIVGYEILGDTDCRFIARYVPLNRILHLYSEAGLLSRKNDLFRYCFISSMTSLNTNAEPQKRRTIRDYSNKQNQIVPLIERDRIRDIEDKLKKRENHYEHLVTLLYQIYDYISFIRYQTPKYEFASLNNPFELLIGLIEGAIKDGEMEQRPFDELYEYLSNMYSNIQENLRTDIRFYGLSDFSMMSYYSPTKLRSFYFSVINKISDYYKNMSEQDSIIDYQFLIFFTNTATTNVTQLWKDKFDENKIMMVKISEKDFYEVNDLVFQLAHEAAHFVGNEEIRNREYRFYQYINFLLTRVDSYIVRYIGTILNPSAGKEEDTVAPEKSFRKYLREARNDITLNKFITEHQYILCARAKKFIQSVLQNGVIAKEKFFYYTDIVKTVIGDYLFNDSFVIMFFNEYWNSLTEHVKKRLMFQLNSSGLSVEKAKQIIGQLQEIQEQLPAVIGNYENQLLYAEFSDSAYAVNILYEAYSDLSAVLLFDLKAVDFCNIIIKRLDLYDEESYKEDMGFIRMCIVLKAMNELYEANAHIINSTYADFFQSIPEQWKSSSRDHMDRFYNNIKEKYIWIDDHNFSISYLYDYILLCLETQCKNIKIDKRKEIKEIYNSTNESDLLQTVIYINNFVAKLGEEATNEDETK